MKRRITFDELVNRLIKVKGLHKGEEVVSMGVSNQDSGWYHLIVTRDKEGTEHEIYTPMYKEEDNTKV